MSGLSSHDHTMSGGRPPRVAIVGGGIAGLVCGARLSQLGITDAVVFDTGRHAAGGRCSSRLATINGQVHTFDHSAQYFTVSDQRFAKVVSFLHSKGAVKVWGGPVGHLKGGKFSRDSMLTQAFVGVEGMRSIAMELSSLVKLEKSSWVSSVNFDPGAGKWQLNDHGFFDYLVVAHNGKCADKLMANAGAPPIHRLLQVRFGDRVDARDARMQLCSMWVLLAAFPQSLGLHYQGAHVEDDPDISWIANNTAKLAKGSNPKPTAPECWTIFSTRSFGSAHKVPQENIPPRKAQEVTERLLAGLARVTSLGSKVPKPVFSKVQLWGAAVPLNVLGGKEECVFDAQRKVGICGDWLVSPCIQGAALSGMALAQKIHTHATGSSKDSTPLAPVFKTVSSSAIGEFPTDPGLIFQPKKT